MAIYPVVKGQQFNQTVVIPPRTSLSEPSARPKAAHNSEGDLIDFGGDGPAPAQPSPKEQPQPSRPQPPLDPSHPSTTEVQELLASTGSRKDGPLIDFHHDMKSNLPGSIKRADSIESDDEFVDAQG